MSSLFTGIPYTSSTNGAIVFNDGNPSIVDTSAFTGGLTGAFTPVQSVSIPLASNVTVTTQYGGGYTPSLASQQTIASGPITPFYPSSRLYVVCFFRVGTTSATQTLGLQPAIYAGSTLLACTFVEVKGLSASANFQERGVMLEGYVSSVTQGTPITISLGANISQSVTQQTGGPVSPFIRSTNFVFLVFEEEVGNAQLIGSTNYLIGGGGSQTQLTSIYSGTNPTSYSGTTAISTLSVTKKIPGSFLQVQGTLAFQAVNSNTNWWGSAYLFTSTTASNTLVASPNTGGFAFSGPSAGSFNNVGLNAIIPPSVLSAGSYTFGLGGQSGNASNITKFCGNIQSSLIISEYNFIAGSGLGTLQNNAFTTVSGAAGTLVTTLTPTYSQLSPIGNTGPIYPISATSRIYLFGNLGVGSGVSSAEDCVLLAVFTSNSASATPIAVIPMSAPSSTQFNAMDTNFVCSAVSPGQYVPLTFYFAVGYTSTASSSTIQMSVSGSYKEVAISTTGTTTVNSITSSSPYLTLSSSSGNIIEGLVSASPTTAGLATITTPLTANSLLRTNNSNALVLTTQPGTSQFGANIFIQFGGANAGQVKGTTTGTCTYLTAAVPTSQTALASPAYFVAVTMVINITTIGTSLGVATIIGMPVTSAYTFTTSAYGSVTSGINPGTSARLVFGFTAGSSTISILTQPNTGAFVNPTPLSNTTTNSPFTAPLSMFLYFQVPTTTPPTN